MGRILAALKTAGRDENTLVVAMADHGESLGEHDEQTHAILIYESSLRIPLILAGPGVPSGRVVEDRVGTVDLLPTLLRLLDAPVPEDLPGRDLRPAFEGPLAEQPIYSESLFGRLNCRWSSLRGITLGNWKLIQGAASELYDLSADPLETRDRSAEDPERASRMRRLLDAALARMAPQGDTARPVALSPEQEERLRSLGYVSGSGGGGALDQPGLPDPRSYVWVYERVQSAVQAKGPAAERALAEVVRIAEHDPGNPYVHFSLANMAYRNGRLSLADRAFSRTLELEPDRPAMRLSYGRLLRDLGRLEESEKHLRIAVEQTTADDVRTPASLAETLVARGSLEEADTILQAAQAREPNHLDVLRVRGLLLVAQRRAAEGVPYLERAAAGRDPGALDRDRPGPARPGRARGGARGGAAGARAQPRASLGAGDRGACARALRAQARGAGGPEAGAAAPAAPARGVARAGARLPVRRRAGRGGALPGAGRPDRARLNAGEVDCDSRDARYGRPQVILEATRSGTSCLTVVLEVIQNAGCRTLIASLASPGSTD